MKRRKFPLCAGAALPMILLFAVIISQDIHAVEIGQDISLTGTMRWRGELDDRDFDKSTAINELQYLRTRLELNITSIDKAQIYFQAQDSRNLGTNSSGLNNDNNLGVHQAFMNLKGVLFDNFDLQLGRFEVKYGRERLLGAVGWSNVGRTFDGIRGSYKAKNNNYDFFILKVLERSFNFPPNHRDWNLYGFYGTVLNNHLDLFFLYDWDMRKAGDDYLMARLTTGVYYRGDLTSNLSLEFDGAYQGGSQAGSDITAYLLAADLSYKLGQTIDKIGFGLDLTSGDDDLGDNKVKAFNNLYYTGHRFRGYMDYFVATQPRGLMDIILRGSLKPKTNFTLNIDLHYFQTMQDYITGGGDESKQRGEEIDITGIAPVNDNLSFQSGLSLFFASDDWQPDANTGTWLYAMLVAGF